VLVQAVMTARPVQHLLVLEAPVWLLDEIDRGLKGFFRAGKEKANGGQFLVAWEQVCKPKELGGLAIKNLRLQGFAMRVRWEWLRRTNNAKPWQGLPMIKDKEASQVFDILARIVVGNGKDVKYWTDR
jgi:hypothetical protein